MCIKMSVLICTTSVIRSFCPSDVKLILVYIRERILFLPQRMHRGNDSHRTRRIYRWLTCAISFLQNRFPGGEEDSGGWLEGYGCVFIHSVPCRMQVACGEYLGTRSEREPSGCHPYGDPWYIDPVGKLLRFIFHIFPFPLSITRIQSVHLFLYTNLRY